MSVLDILIGKPLATSDERAEQIGVSAGIPIFGLDALSSAAYGPEAALTLLIPLGAAGVAYIVPISASIIVLLAIVYLFLPADDCGVSGGRRVLHRRHGESRHVSGAAGRRSADDRLHPRGRRGHLGRRGRAGFGCAESPAAHAPDLPRDSAGHHDRQSARPARGRHFLHASDVSLRRIAAGRDRDRLVQDGARRRASDAGRGAAAAPSRR